MADSRTFRLLDANATPVVSQFRDRSGNARAAPAIVSLGNRLFRIRGTDADVATGTAYLITTGSQPAHVSGAFFLDGAPFAAMHFEDGAGGLWAGAAPSVSAYRDMDGNARTSPGLSALVAGQTSFYGLMPSNADVALGVGWSVDGAAGCINSYDGSFSTPYSSAIGAGGPSVRVESIAAQALRDFLLVNLPSKVTAVNAGRNAVLMSPWAGLFTVPAGAVLKYSAIGIDGPWTNLPLTSGVRTGAQVAADINAVVPGLGSTDNEGRFLLTALLAPLTGAPSLVALGGDTTGANAAFGWDAGGERVVRNALEPPTYKGIADGWPVSPDMGPGFWVIIGDRESVPVAPDARRDEHLVGLEVTIVHKETNVSPHRSREHIQSALRCVRELLLTDAGRQFGRAAYGDIAFVTERKAQISGKPFAFKGPSAPNVLFDVAVLVLSARVFERPASS